MIGRAPRKVQWLVKLVEKFLVIEQNGKVVQNSQTSVEFVSIIETSQPPGGID